MVVGREAYSQCSIRKFNRVGIQDIAVVLVISLGYMAFRNNEYICALVIPGTSGGMMGNFHQYAQQLKKELNPDLDEYYLTNIIDKALK